MRGTTHAVTMAGEEPMTHAFDVQRRMMVETQLAARGIRDQRVLDAMATVPRERFIAPSLAHLAYDDGPQPIGNGQTISQPWIVAGMAEALRLQGHERVLEIGTGSGYAAAVLSLLCARVVSVERDAMLCNRARATLMTLGFRNIRVIQGDGTLGVDDEAPFDGISVTAVGPAPPPSLLAQLARGGRLVMPIGTPTGGQRLVVITRALDGALDEQDLGEVRFVPLIGAEAFPELPEFPSES